MQFMATPGWKNMAVMIKASRKMFLSMNAMIHTMIMVRSSRFASFLFKKLEGFVKFYSNGSCQPLYGTPDCYYRNLRL